AFVAGIVAIVNSNFKTQLLLRTSFTEMSSGIISTMFIKMIVKNGKDYLHLKYTSKTNV
ncbi:hypothetical protein GX50_08365, partial [[Emmonsia] crescens]